jgi:hypothetical protein
MLNYDLYHILYKIIIAAMKYINLFDNFTMVPEFDECKCSLINLSLVDN